MIRLASIVIFAFTFIYSGFSQGEKTIKPKKLKRDFKKMIELIDAHPDPYRALPEEAFIAYLDSVELSLNKPMSEGEYYKVIASTLALMKDGHTSAYLDRNWLKKKRKKHGAFPYKVHLSNDDKLYVVDSYSDNNKIAKGAEITKINEMPVSEFISTIDPWISYEVTPFRNVIIELNFERYLHLVFGTTRSLKLHYYTTEETSELVSNITQKEYKALMKDQETEEKKRAKSNRPYDYELLEEGVGLISVYRFMGTRTESFLEKSFKQIREDRVHSLIIDVRGNFGGLTRVSSSILHYITEKHFKNMAVSRKKISQPLIDNLKDMVRDGSRKTSRRSGQVNYGSLQDSYEEYLGGEIGDIVIKTEAWNESPETREYEFYGNVYLLTDRRSYSMASLFASTFKCYQMGTIIGEPTGGTKIFSAHAFPTKLNNSKITVNMSSNKDFASCFNEDDEPILPDFEVKRNVLDIVNDFDSQLNFTLRLIKKVRKKKQEK